MGGEKKINAIPDFCRVGSPPRGRGKDHVQIAVLVQRGITPAWAGKSPLHVLPNGLSGDHPRVGGEKTPPKRGIF